MASTEPAAAGSTRPDLVRVWDLPIRVFHWSIVCLVAISWASAENGYLRLHLWCGLTMLTLLLRAYWL